MTLNPNIDHFSWGLVKNIFEPKYLKYIEPMKDLVTVNLTYNEIEIIEIDAFDDLDSLTALYLR